MIGKLVEEKNASDEVQKIYNEIKATLKTPHLPNWVKAMGGNANLLKANWEKTKNTLVIGEIPLLLKELLIFKVSVKNGSPYCSACHAHAALQLDKNLKFEDLERLASGENLSGLPKAFQVALETIPRITLEPNSFSDQDIQKLKDVGFSMENISELLAQGDLAVMFNTITMTYKVPLDDEYRGIDIGQYTTK